MPRRPFHPLSALLLPLFLAALVLWARSFGSGAVRDGVALSYPRGQYVVRSAAGRVWVDALPPPNSQRGAARAKALVAGLRNDSLVVRPRERLSSPSWQVLNDATRQ